MLAWLACPLPLAVSWTLHAHDQPPSSATVDKEKVGGPPHGVWPELYESLLTPVGFELVSLTPVPVDKSHPNRGGKEIMGMWRRKA